MKRIPWSQCSVLQKADRIKEEDIKIFNKAAKLYEEAQNKKANEAKDKS